MVSLERSVHLDSIYVPLDLRGNNTLSLTVDNNVVLEGENRAIFIKGIAGQGKSTILRKLLANSLREKRRVPIFIELKNYKGGTIEELIKDHLGAFGITLDDIGLAKILGDSNVRVFLDAFDEVDPKNHSLLVSEIQRLINRYKCLIVCTSRPDTELDSLSEGEIYHVQFLTDEKIHKIIAMAAADKEKAEELSLSLRRSPLHGRGEDSILRTPILVVLFCVSYNVGQNIPDSLSQFYANIFETLFFKHDNIKGRVNRERVFNDNRSIYCKLFQVFSFQVQLSTQKLSRQVLVETMGKSLSYHNRDELKADAVFDEICKITNLILEDGYDEFRYIHKSIQEYFSACFIASLRTDEKRTFYSSCIESSFTFFQFQGSLFFLSEIDELDWAEMYFARGVQEALGIPKGPLSDDYEISQNLMQSFINAVMVNVSVETSSTVRGHQGAGQIVLEPTLVFQEGTSSFTSRFFNSCFASLFSEGRKKGYIDKFDSHFIRLAGSTVSLSSLIDGGIITIPDLQGQMRICVATTFLKTYSKAIGLIAMNERRPKVSALLMLKH